MNPITETNAERLEAIDVVRYEEDQDGNQCALLKEDDYWFLKEQAEKVNLLEKHNLEYFDMHKKLKGENKRLCEVLKELKTHSIQCDADCRAIQPYEIIDRLNEYEQL